MQCKLHSEVFIAQVNAQAATHRSFCDTFRPLYPPLCHHHHGHLMAAIIIIITAILITAILIIIPVIVTIITDEKDAPLIIITLKLFLAQTMKLLQRHTNKVILARNRCILH